MAAENTKPEREEAGEGPPSDAVPISLEFGTLTGKPKFSGKALSSWDSPTVLDAQEPAAGEDGPEMLGFVK